MHRKAALALNLSGHAHPDAENQRRRDPGAFEHLAYAGNDPSDHLLRLGVGSRQRLLGAVQQPQREVEQLDVNVRLGDIDADQRAAVGAHRDQPAWPTAFRILISDLDQYPPVEQLADQIRDGRQAQAGDRREFLPGDRRRGDDVTQHLVAVAPADVARRALHQCVAPLTALPRLHTDAEILALAGLTHWNYQHIRDKNNCGQYIRVAKRQT